MRFQLSLQKNTSSGLFYDRKKPILAFSRWRDDPVTAERSITHGLASFIINGRQIPLYRNFLQGARCLSVKFISNT